MDLEPPGGYDSPVGGLTGRGWVGVTGALALTSCALMVFGLAGCGDEEIVDPVRPDTLPVVGFEYAFDVPGSGRAGVVELDVSNAGEELHEYSLIKLDEGKTQEDVEAFLRTGRQEPPGWVEDVAGVPLLSPGERISITRELEPATYTLLCFIPSPEGVPHVELGMIRSFRLTGDSGAPLPEPDAVISATDSGFDIPELEAGSQTIELRNADDRDREFFLIALKPGKTLADIDRFFAAGEDQAEPPATFLGAMQTIPPGESVFAFVDLEADTEYTLNDNTGSQPVVATFTPR